MRRPSRCLYLVVSAAPPVLRIEEFVTALQAEDWPVAVIATPTAASWVDPDAIAAATGCLTRAHPRPPHEQDSLPQADPVVAAPMTFNTINKWAAGISDTLALGVLNELAGTDVPILAVPYVKSVLRKHPAYNDSITRLTGIGVSIMDPDAITVRADDGLATFEWPTPSQPWMGSTSDERLVDNLLNSYLLSRGFPFQRGQRKPRGSNVFLKLFWLVQSNPELRLLLSRLLLQLASSGLALRLQPSDLTQRRVSRRKSRPTRRSNRPP